jgi:sulfur carrier protein
MRVLVNHKIQELKDNANLMDLLTHMQLPEKGIALAIDNKVIPKNKWQSFELSDQMKVTMIRATQGG